jgi:hypothetical protein
MERQQVAIHYPKIMGIKEPGYFCSACKEDLEEYGLGDYNTRKMGVAYKIGI